MVMLPFLVSGLMASASVASYLDTRSEAQHSCGTRSISPEEKELFARQAPEPDDGEEIKLGCVMHFCCTQGRSCPSDSVAKTAVDDMNSFLKGSKMSFSLEDVTRTDDARCAAAIDDDATIDGLKADLRQGNTSTLNILYHQTSRQFGINGRCYEQQPGINIPFSFIGRDGCVVSMSTLRGDDGRNSSIQNNNNKGGGDDKPRILSRRDGVVGDAAGLSVTTSHEMGHWLTLSHVDGKKRRQAPTDGVFGAFSSLFSRQDDNDVGNVMESVARQGKRYKFNDAQIAQMRSAARNRLKMQSVPVGGRGSSPTTPQNQGPPNVPKGGNAVGEGRTPTTPESQGPRIAPKGGNAVGGEGRIPTTPQKQGPPGIPKGENAIGEGRTPTTPESQGLRIVPEGANAVGGEGRTPTTPESQGLRIAPQGGNAAGGQVRAPPRRPS